jgi:hypothetical protein
MAIRDILFNQDTLLKIHPGRFGLKTEENFSSGSRTVDASFVSTSVSTSGGGSIILQRTIEGHFVKAGEMVTMNMAQETSQRRTLVSNLAKEVNYTSSAFSYRHIKDSEDCCEASTTGASVTGSERVTKPKYVSNIHHPRKLLLASVFNRTLIGGTYSEYQGTPSQYREKSTS